VSVVLGWQAMQVDSKEPMFDLFAQSTSRHQLHLLLALEGHTGRCETIGAIGALMNRVHQLRTLLVLGHNAGMGTAAGAGELVEIRHVVDSGCFESSRRHPEDSSVLGRVREDFAR
jgi:hypothetical protein